MVARVQPSAAVNPESIFRNFINENAQGLKDRETNRIQVAWSWDKFDTTEDLTLV